jgi:hypothetical protein
MGDFLFDSFFFELWDPLKVVKFYLPPHRSIQGDSSTRFFTSGFFNRSTPSGPLIHHLKYSQFGFEFTEIFLFELEWPLYIIAASQTNMSSLETWMSLAVISTVHPWVVFV